MKASRNWRSKENRWIHVALHRIQMAWKALTSSPVVLIAICKSKPGDPPGEVECLHVGHIEDVSDMVISAAVDMSQQFQAEEEARQIIESTMMGPYEE